MPNLNYAEQWSPDLLEILMQETLTSPFVTTNVRWLDARTFHFTQMSVSGYKNHKRTIVLIVIALAVIGAGIYFYVRDKTLDEIRADVYKKFLEAEHDETLTTGKKKMTWVLIQARMLLPNWAQVFITDAFLEKVVEGWFQAVKDLLDDGKLNKSTEVIKNE